jgi:hypothetical protein
MTKRERRYLEIEALVKKLRKTTAELKAVNDRNLKNLALYSMAVDPYWLPTESREVAALYSYKDGVMTLVEMQQISKT